MKNSSKLLLITVAISATAWAILPNSKMAGPTVDDVVKRGPAYWIEFSSLPFIRPFNGPIRTARIQGDVIYHFDPDGWHSRRNDPFEDATRHFKKTTSGVTTYLVKKGDSLADTAPYETCVITTNTKTKLSYKCSHKTINYEQATGEFSVLHDGKLIQTITYDDLGRKTQLHLPNMYTDNRPAKAYTSYYQYTEKTIIQTVTYGKDPNQSWLDRQWESISNLWSNKKSKYIVIKQRDQHNNLTTLELQEDTPFALDVEYQYWDNK